MALRLPGRGTITVHTGAVFPVVVWNGLWRVVSLSGLDHNNQKLIVSRSKLDHDIVSWHGLQEATLIT